MGHAGPVRQQTQARLACRGCTSLTHVSHRVTDSTSSWQHVAQAHKCRQPAQALLHASLFYLQLPFRYHCNKVLCQATYPSAGGSISASVHVAERFMTELNGCTGACPQDDKVVAVLWLACHDPFEDNAEAAATLWEYSGADLASSFVPALTQYLGHPNADVRSAAAAALAAGLQVYFPSPGCVAYLMCCWSLPANKHFCLARWQQRLLSD